MQHISRRRLLGAGATPCPSGWLGGSVDVRPLWRNDFSSFLNS